MLRRSLHSYTKLVILICVFGWTSTNVNPRARDTSDACLLSGKKHHFSTGCLVLESLNIIHQPTQESEEISKAAILTKLIDTCQLREKNITKMLRHSPSFFMELTILIFIFAWASISGAEAFTEVDLSCNFERNFCQWESGRRTDSKFAWIRNKGETITSKTGPSYDHTYQNPNRGYYAYLETSNPLYNRATLESPVIRSNHSHCLRFWYNMNGADVSRLQVVSSTLEILWSKEHNHGNIWLLAEVDIFLRVQQYKISITGYAGNSYEADIAIDDITWEKGLCKNTEFDNLKCNFESGYCGWTNVGFDNFDWTRRSGSTYSINTGPDYDHTLQTPNGYYAYMEASDRHAGEKVILVSRVLNNKRPICFSFWYHMHGKRVGKLLIKVVTKNSTEVLWVKEGSQGQDWKEAKINITTIPREYQIHIVAVCGLDWSSDIAIDDIEINEGSCGIHPCNQNPCKNGRCNIISSVSYTCDCWIGYEGKHCEIFKGYKACESNPCLSGTCVSLANGRRYKCQCPPGFTGAQCLRISNWTCDFKKDFCSWEQSDLDTLDWEFAELENRDRYLSLFNRDGSNGFAIIKSPLLQGNDKLCFKFSYLIVGNTTSLAVTTSFNGKIWSKDGGRINTWRKAAITIDKVDRYVLFKIYITALRRRGDGRIALDDVQLLPGKCPNLDCNFQDDFCAWNNAFFDDFDWGRRSGPVTTTSIGAKTSTKLRPGA
ncbi:uncharacterized protein TRIADDRAFT_53234 [Trichoplax adhaerens]|uniref:MAM and LDL-receptor class A domain-containing protein 1 n=1 Tax=Trichoplax adhaerens TaxID=10228 RepID=B3RNN9_TRIAD|nr:hypothetical protein TRIADDRAFT_53234 [Trichoplax adhaerens]EDV27491.1 hypothetical protein TRIADDRAFT_53234 [Trichoplax adhaerens]|eukprot:XP_002109325.1 hypothetical protein TRIADDRAFT_53234 [Trichoplax adhaerens]